MVVVGRLPGTGVPAVRNVRTAERNRATATSTVGPPSGTLTARDTSRTGNATCINRPRAIAPTYTHGGRMIPRLATSDTMPVSALSLRTSLVIGSLDVS